LPLLSPVFRRSHFSRQVPPSATTREILAAKCGTVGEKDVLILPKFRPPLKFRDLLHAANLRHGTDSFTSPPKEGVLKFRDLLHAANLQHGTDGFTSPPKEGVLWIFSP